MVRKTPYFVLALLSAAILGACSSTLDTSDLEKGFATEIEDSTGVAVDVTCPDDIEAKEGGEFNCSGTAPDGTEISISVVQEDDEGNVTMSYEVVE